MILAINFGYLLVHHWLVGLCHGKYVLCEVRTESLYTVSMNIRLQLALPLLKQVLAGASSRRPRFDPRSVHVRFVVDNVAPEQAFFQNVGVPCLYHSTSDAHSSSSTCCSDQKDDWAKQFSVGSRGASGKKGALTFVDCLRIVCSGGLWYRVILSVLDPRKCEYLKDYSLYFEHAYMTT